jgi:HSP20 family molecular chaperone IbpA
MNGDFWDDNDIFGLIDRLINSEFYGGYSRGDSSYRYRKEYDSAFIEDDKYIYFTLELRGISEDNMSVAVHETELKLELMKEGRWKYYTIPITVDGVRKEVIPETAEISFNNCILDIIMEKKQNDI